MINNDVNFETSVIKADCMIKVKIKLDWHKIQKFWLNAEFNELNQVSSAQFVNFDQSEW